MIKNIILTSAVDDKNYKGMISLENTQNKVLITLKTYNLPETRLSKVFSKDLNHLRHLGNADELLQSYIINEYTEMGMAISSTKSINSVS